MRTQGSTGVLAMPDPDEQPAPFEEPSPDPAPEIDPGEGPSEVPPLDLPDPGPMDQPIS
jgi:hypothetical protein